jgi:hypothetical protein
LERCAHIVPAFKLIEHAREVHFIGEFVFALAEIDRGGARRDKGVQNREDAGNIKWRLQRTREPGDMSANSCRDSKEEASDTDWGIEKQTVPLISRPTVGRIGSDLKTPLIFVAPL